MRISVKNIGAIPAFNDQYYAEIFMRPGFHFNEYLLGVIMSLVYMRFVKERALSDQVENSRTSRLINFIQCN